MVPPHSFRSAHPVVYDELTQHHLVDDKVHAVPPARTPRNPAAAGRQGQFGASASRNGSVGLEAYGAL